MGCSSESDTIRKNYAEMISRPPLPFPDGLIAYFQLIRKASDSHNSEACSSTIRAYLDAGVSVVPSLINGLSRKNAAEIVADSVIMRLVPEAIRQEWMIMAGSGPSQIISEIMRPVTEQSIENVKMLSDAGIIVLAGTDVGGPFLVPGRTLHDELSVLVNAGLSPLEALQAATLNPVRIFGLSDSLGSVAEGYKADLVLLEANPLENIEHVSLIAGVVLRGQYYDRESLDDLITEAIK